MATVDTLLVRIEADLGSLRRDLARVQRSTDVTTKRMSRSFDKVSQATQKTGRAIKQVGAAIVAAMAFRSVVNVTSSFEDLQLTLNTVFKTAESGEAAMQFIIDFAQRTPFDIQTLTRSFIQLGGAGVRPTEKLLTTLGDAASATTNRLQTFEALTRVITRSVGGGLGLEELEQLVTAGIPVYRILNDELGITRTEISELGQTADGAKRIMDGLLTGLDKEFGGGMQRASKNLSVALSNLGIAATDLTKSFGDAFNDSLTELANTTSQLLTNLKPLASFLGSVLAVAVEALNLALRALNTAIEFVGKSINFIRNALADLNEDLLGFLRPTEQSTKALAQLEETLGKNIKAMSQNSKEAEQYTKRITGLREEVQKLKAINAGFDPVLVEELAKAGGLSNIRGNTLAMPPDEEARDEDKVALTAAQINAIENLVAARKKQQAILDKRTTSLNLAKSAVADLKTENMKLEETLIALQFAFDKNVISLEEFEAASKIIGEQIQQLDPMFNHLRSSVANMSAGISEAFADMLMSGKLNMESLRDVFSSFVRTMIAKAIELMVINKIMNMAFNLTGSAALPTAASGGAIPARAGGGPVLVGERGPELFIPNSAGVIRNNHDTLNMMRGGTQEPVVNQTINVTTGVATTVRAEILSMMPRIKSETISAMIDGKKRGNVVGKVF